MSAAEQLCALDDSTARVRRSARRNRLDTRLSDHPATNRSPCAYARFLEQRDPKLVIAGCSAPWFGNELLRGNVAIAPRPSRHKLDVDCGQPNREPTPLAQPTRGCRHSLCQRDGLVIGLGELHRQEVVSSFPAEEHRPVHQSLRHFGGSLDRFSTLMTGSPEVLRGGRKAEANFGRRPPRRHGCPPALSHLRAAHDTEPAREPNTLAPWRRLVRVNDDWTRLPPHAPAAPDPMVETAYARPDPEPARRGRAPRGEARAGICHDDEVGLATWSCRLHRGDAPRPAP